MGMREGGGGGKEGGGTFDHSGWCFFAAHSVAIRFMNSCFHISFLSQSSNN